MGEYTQFTMRIDNEVYELVKHSAEKNKRSIAKEIEFILEQWCKPPKDIEVTPEMNEAIIKLLKVFKKEGALPDSFRF